MSRAAAAQLGLELVVHEYARPPYDLPEAFARFAASRAEVLANLVNRHWLPAVYPNAVWVEAGGLLGADPATMPMEQARVVELVLNLRAARALGLAVPPSIRLRADRLIE